MSQEEENIPEAKVKCNLCAHPARDIIDGMLCDTRYTLENVREWAMQHYPKAFVPNISGFSLHRKWHIKTIEPIRSNSLVVKDGQVVDLRGRPVPVPDLNSALKALMAIGLRNILNNPERVGVKDTIEIMKILKSMTGDEAQKEFFEEWAAATEAPPKKKRSKKETAVEADYEEADPWAELEEDGASR